MPTSARRDVQGGVSCIPRTGAEFGGFKPIEFSIREAPTWTIGRILEELQEQDDWKLQLPGQLATQVCERPADQEKLIWIYTPQTLEKEQLVAPYLVTGEPNGSDEEPVGDEAIIRLHVQLPGQKDERDATVKTSPYPPPFLVRLCGRIHGKQVDYNLACRRNVTSRHLCQALQECLKNDGISCKGEVHVYPEGYDLGMGTRATQILVLPTGRKLQ